MTHEFDRAQVVHNDLGNWLCLHIKNAPMARVECEQMKEGKTYTAEVKKKYEKRSGRANAYELNQQGVAPNESLGRGIVSGVIEAATEKSPMESLANIATKGGKGLVSNIAKQALSEAGEESLGYAANYAADVAANDPNAHFSLSELGQNALGGAAGGAMFAGIGTGIHALRKGVNYLSTARNGNNAAQNQTATVDTQAQTQYTNTNGGVANGINGQQNGNGDFSAGLQGRPDGTAFDSAVPNRGSNDGRANSGLSDGVLLTSKKTRQIMDERGLPNLGLKESTGDNTSFFMRWNRQRPIIRTALSLIRSRQKI